MSAAQIDHLVVMAATLEEGVAWCEATLGVTPDAGGQHAFMGTHNRLLRTSSAVAPHSYLEIIAIDPAGNPPTQGQRWFDMDQPTLRAAVAAHGPQLIHWVARASIVSATTALHALGQHAGTPQSASRHTLRGLLEWQIGLRADGQRLMDGLLPTLIQWGDIHPEATMADHGVQLQRLELHHPQAPTLQAALDAIGLKDSAAIHIASASQPALIAHLQTPKGAVQLHSHLG